MQYLPLPLRSVLARPVTGHLPPRPGAGLAHRILRPTRHLEGQPLRTGDDRVFDLLAAGRDIITRQLAGQQSILRELGRS